jgi:hypothetical protein
VECHNPGDTDRSSGFPQIGNPLESNESVGPVKRQEMGKENAAKEVRTCD